MYLEKPDAEFVIHRNKFISLLGSSLFIVMRLIIYRRGCTGNTKAATIQEGAPVYGGEFTT